MRKIKESAIILAALMIALSLVVVLLYYSRDIVTLAVCGLSLMTLTATAIAVYNDKED